MCPSTGLRERFWERYSLAEMTDAEWEAVCDGCGQCCQIKLEDPDSRERALTDVVCRLMDVATARCSDYEHRFARVPECLQLSRETLSVYEWLPDSCGYRRLHEHRSLAGWHPLRAGNDRRMREKGICVAGRVYSEAAVPDEALSDHIIAILPMVPSAR